MMDIPDKFSFVENGPEGERLILPAFGVGNQSWKDWKYRWMRSLHVSAVDNTIISVGWPKFMNLGEGCDKYNVGVDELLRRSGQEMFATLKIDGSLLIRYVRDNEVRWRTRGSLRVGLDNVDEIDYFCAEHPMLADPSFYPNKSILFEWVSPQNKVVLTYDHPQLFLIGGVHYDVHLPWWIANLRLFTMTELEKVEELGVELTDFYPLRTREEITRLIENLNDNKDIEGFVVRFDGCQQMVKLKTEHYVTLHALRSCLTTAMLVDLWHQWGKPTFREYADLFDKAYDYECWQWAIGAVSAMYDGIKVAQDIHAHIVQFVEDNRAMAEECRRDYALLAQQKYDGLRLSACFTLLDRREITPEFWKKLILQNCKQVELRMFSNPVEEDDG